MRPTPARRRSRRAGAPATVTLTLRRMPDRKTWIVTTDGIRPIDEIVPELARAGLHVEQVLDAIGSVTGTADASALDAVRAVRGVVDVSPDGAVDVGPPGDADTW